MTDPQSPAPDLVDRAVQALPPAPPPPPFARIRAALAHPPSGTGTPRRKTRAAWRIAAAAALIAALGLFALSGPRSENTPPDSHTAVVLGSGWAREAGPTSLATDTLLTAADGPAEVRWRHAGRGLRLLADAGTRLHVRAGHHVDLAEGRVWIEVEPARTLGANDVVVTAGAHTVQVVGTVFTVQALSGRAVQVDVVRGKVKVDQTPVAAGMTFVSGAAKPQQRPVAPWLPAPTLVLARGQAAPDEMVFSLQLQNRSAVTLPLPAPAGNRTALWVQWLDREGREVRSVPVRPTHVEGEEAWVRGDRALRLPPDAVRTLWIRFRAGDRPPGAYRCRALVRPAGTAPVLSNVLGLED